MLRKCLSVLAGATLLSGMGAIISSPSYANGTVFLCDTSGSIPKTVARNSSGRTLTVINWVSEYFSGSGYDSVTRCQEVSARFQKARNNGSLDYITAGIVNGYPVVCTTTPGGSCNSQNVLFTLKRNANAAVVLQRLFDVRDSAGPALYESSGRTYINLNPTLDALESGEGASTPQDSTNPNNQPSQPSGGSF